MESALQKKTNLADVDLGEYCTCKPSSPGYKGAGSICKYHPKGETEEREPVSSKNIPTGQRVDQRIDDVVRMTLATACIVLESEGRDMTIGSANLEMLISKMRTRVLQLLSVKERRNG
jgi:hypothetical protein